MSNNPTVYVSIYVNTTWILPYKWHIFNNNNLLKCMTLGG